VNEGNNTPKAGHNSDATYAPLDINFDSQDDEILKLREDCLNDSSETLTNGACEATKLERALAEYLRSIAIGLHLLAFFFHLGLLICFPFHPERRIHIHVENQKRASIILTTVLQLYSVVSKRRWVVN
jgi:hypothetical protein